MRILFRSFSRTFRSSADQDILARSALIGGRRLPVPAFRSMARPLRSDSGQTFSLLIDPCHVAYREAVDIKFLMS